MRVDTAWAEALNRGYPDKFQRPEPVRAPVAVVEFPIGPKPLDCGRITVAKVLFAVAKHYRFTIAEIQSARKRVPLVLARHVAMYLCRELTTASYPELGRRFGGRDHSTVIHGVRRIKSLVDNGDEETTEALKSLRAKLEEGAAG